MAVNVRSRVAIRLTTPRAAAVAGILFALLFGTSLYLVRRSIPADPTSGGEHVAANAREIRLALAMLPYAGIAFLWFIGVIRDRLGELEDRFFATVFLGSGLTFLAMIFVGGALAGGLVASSTMESGAASNGPVLTYSRQVMFQVINVYAIRMAGVFMISLGTIWFRTGLMHRGWALVTYAMALVLLVSISYSLWVVFVFPLWVLAVSIFFLIESFRGRAPALAARA